jgi:PhnB protein
MVAGMSHGIPRDQQSATPYLVVRGGAKAIEFYVRAFGAREELRLDMPDGRLGHAQLVVGAAKFMLAEEFPEYGYVGPKTLGGTTVGIQIYVEDVDAFADRAIAAGATLKRPIKDEFYGDRVAQLEDPFGHRWNFCTRVEEVSLDEMKRRMAAL